MILIEILNLIGTAISFVIGLLLMLFGVAFMAFLVAMIFKDSKEEIDRYNKSS